MNECIICADGKLAALCCAVLIRQEKSKDPTVRFDAFVKKQSAAQGAPVESCFGNTSTSGSFGGKPKMVRKGKKGKKVAPPAWLRGGGEGES